MSQRNSIKVWEGPSELDGAPIMLLLTGLAKSSKNAKTGDLLQTWILRSDVAPHVAVKTGQDSSVCGNCGLRPLLHKVKPIADKPCYVKVFQAPLSTWKANRNAPVFPVEGTRALVAGRRVRRGSYGDPGAVPAHVWRLFDENPGTGYTHQWRDAHLSSFAMASVHDATERAEARARGYRTFRVSADASDILPGEILCPASKEAGARVQCADCNLCDGSRALEPVPCGVPIGVGVRRDPDWGRDPRKDIVIPAH